MVTHHDYQLITVAMDEYATVRNTATTGSSMMSLKSHYSNKLKDDFFSIVGPARYICVL
jgi:nitrate reductase cytochrome c-type subunit